MDFRKIRWLRTLKSIIQNPAPALAADAELLDQIKVGLAVALGDVAQQAAAAANHLQQPAAGHKIVLIGLQMLGDLFDTIGQYSYLGARTARIILVYLRAFDSGRLLLRCNHVQVL